ncbi:MAG TPA: T9SS type A sorting domain-containing protein [Bacteroidia bacterium]
MKRILKYFIITFPFLWILFPNTLNANTTYYASQSGSWSNPAIWYTGSCGGTACSCTPGNNDNIVICSGYTVTNNGSITLNTGRSLTIQNGATLNMLNAGVMTLGGGALTINTGGTLEVNVFTNDPGTTVVNGSLILGGVGHPVITNSSPITGTGSITVPAGTNVTNTGTVFGGSSFCTGCTIVAPLPVELFSFSASVENNSVNVKWITASEKNNNFFTVERSRDGNNFQELSVVQAAGNSNSLRNYEAVDADPFAGISYYRLKQTDFSGEGRYFDMIPVQFFSKENLSTEVSPTAVNSISDLHVQISGKSNSAVQLILRDVLGKEYFSTAIILENGNYLFTFDSGSLLSPGVYFLTASGSDSFISKKIIIK